MCRGTDEESTGDWDVYYMYRCWRNKMLRITFTEEGFKAIGYRTARDSELHAGVPTYMMTSGPIYWSD